MKIIFITFEDRWQGSTSNMGHTRRVGFWLIKAHDLLGLKQENKWIKIRRKGSGKGSSSPWERRKGTEIKKKEGRLRGKRSCRGEIKKRVRELLGKVGTDAKKKGNGVRIRTSTGSKRRMTRGIKGRHQISFSPPLFQSSFAPFSSYFHHGFSPSPPCWCFSYER